MYKIDSPEIQKKYSFFHQTPTHIYFSDPQPPKKKKKNEIENFEPPKMD